MRPRHDSGTSAGKDLVQGETDGSSYANGGLRGTHCAGGYVQAGRRAVTKSRHYYLDAASGGGRLVPC